MKTLACALAALMAPACAASPAQPSPFSATALIAGALTEAFEYRHAAGDTIDVEWQEAYHRWATTALGVSPTRRIRFNKYRSRQHMSELIGVGNTNAWADGSGFEIHTIWPRDNHEVVHLAAAEEEWLEMLTSTSGGGE